LLTIPLIERKQSGKQTRPVSLAGLSFRILKAPPDFEVVIDNQKIPKDGVLSLDIYSGTGKEKKILIDHELLREALRA
jgi:hypothetical protein